MSALLCHRLMEYRERSLPDSERAAFEVHLAECPRCQQELAAEDRLDRVLSSAATMFTLPPQLVNRIEQRLRRAQRHRRLVWVSGLAAAVFAIVVLTWQRHPTKRAEDNTPPPMARETMVPPVPSDAPRPPVTVAFAPENRVIARPMATENPAVTLIWIYPAIQTTADNPSSTQTP